MLYFTFHCFVAFAATGADDVRVSGIEFGSDRVEGVSGGGRCVVRPEVSLVRHAGSLVRVVRTVLATERTVRYSLLKKPNKRYCFRK